jgi:hypothetical protein
MLMDAAKTLGPLDAALARETYLEAIEAAIHTGPLGRRRGVRARSGRARAADAAGAARPVARRLVTRFTQGYEASA